MTRNTYPRLLRIVQRIKARPELWYQGAWHSIRGRPCSHLEWAYSNPHWSDSAHCTAGHAQIDSCPAEHRDELLEAIKNWALHDVNTRVAGVSANPQEAGREWLELDEWTSCALFSVRTNLVSIETFLERAKAFALAGVDL